jgi:hypothetical protein
LLCNVLRRDVVQHFWVQREYTNTPVRRARDGSSGSLGAVLNRGLWTVGRCYPGDVSAALAARDRVAPRSAGMAIRCWPSRRSCRRPLAGWRGGGSRRRRSTVDLRSPGKLRPGPDNEKALGPEMSAPRAFGEERRPAARKGSDGGPVRHHAGPTVRTVRTATCGDGDDGDDGASAACGGGGPSHERARLPVKRRRPTQ